MPEWDETYMSCTRGNPFEENRQESGDIGEVFKQRSKSVVYERKREGRVDGQVSGIHGVWDIQESQWGSLDSQSLSRQAQLFWTS
jgi:hypothetical protein